MKKEDKIIFGLVIIGIMITPFAIYILPRLEEWVESFLALL